MKACDRRGATALNEGDVVMRLLQRVGVGVVMACAAASVQAQEPTQAIPPLTVLVAPARMQTSADVTERFAGVAAPRRESQLGFEVGGVLDAVMVDVGDVVAAGDALAALDLRSLDAQIAAAEASVRQADANAQLAALTAERQRVLVARGNTPEQARDDAAANEQVTKATAAAARAELDRLRVRRDLSILQAPYDGVITERYRDEGAIAASGAPVVDIAEVGRLEIRVGLPKDQASALTVGQTYPFEAEGREVEAVLRGVTNIVDRRSQTVAAVFDLADARVTPGAIARLRVTGATQAEGFWAPLTALSTGRRGLWTVMAVIPADGVPHGASDRADNDVPDGVPDGADTAADDLYIAERRLVEVIYTEAERAYVRGAMADGELFVTAGLDRVIPGQRVRVVQEAAGAPSRRVAARRAR